MLMAVCVLCTHKNAISIFEWMVKKARVCLLHYEIMYQLAHSRLSQFFKEDLPTGDLNLVNHAYIPELCSAHAVSISLTITKETYVVVRRYITFS